jgi:hypothetical protein
LKGDKIDEKEYLNTEDEKDEKDEKDLYILNMFE